MINCIKIDYLNLSEFDKKYRVFKVIRIDDFIITRESPLIVFSVSYSDSNNFLVLTEAKTTKEEVYKVFPEQHYVISAIESSALDKKELLNLILKKQANCGLKYNNLSAQLNIIEESKKDQKVCLSYSVGDGYVLSCKINTFSILSDKTIKHFTPKTQKAISQNRITIFEANDSYIYRAAGKDIKKKYIQRSLSRKKNTLDYFSIDTADNKVAGMFRLMREVNNENRSFIKLGFETVDYQRVLEEKRSSSTYQKLVNTVSGDLLINVIDYCDRREQIQSLLDKNMINYRFSNRPNAEGMNIAVIRSKDEYAAAGEDDKHAVSQDHVLQNIIYDNLNDTTLRQCWLEMMIKKEAVSGKIVAFPLKGSWSFFKSINKRVHCLRVVDNVVEDLSSISVDIDVMKIMEQYEDLDPHFIKNDEIGSVLIVDTDLRLLPDWNRITESKEEYTENKDGRLINKIRTYRNQYFGEAIDVNEFVYNGNRYYSVGEIGYGMNKSIGNSPATKMIIEKGLTLRMLAGMLEPNIYQINKYAVYPYPFKLMDEIFLMRGGVLDD